MLVKYPHTAVMDVIEKAQNKINYFVLRAELEYCTGSTAPQGIRLCVRQEENNVEQPLATCPLAILTIK